jgi:hypothetical protein
MKYALGMLVFDREHGDAIVMEYGVMVRTFDRGRVNYLEQTLESFQRSIAPHALVSGSLHLFDSGSPDPAWLDGYPGVHHFPERKLTPNENAVALMRGVAEVDCDWALFLEDDIIFCDDFLGSVDRWLTEHASPDRHLYSFYTPYKEVQNAAERGDTYWQYPIKNFYGTQCLAMRREDMLSAADGLELIMATWHSTKGYDLLLKAWAKETWPKIDYFLASAPSFVQHIGTESAISSAAAFHSNGSFQGEAWSYKGRVNA